MDERSRSIRSIETMFDVVTVLVENDGAGVTEVATELDLAKSTVHQQLSTLRELGYAVVEDGEYHPGLRFLEIGEHTRERKRMHVLAEPLVEQLADETAERAQFFVKEHGRAIYLYTKEGERAVKVNRRPGKVRYLHSSAGGKAILSGMSREDVEAVIERWGLPAETEKTITDDAALFEELDRISERGFATNKEESITGLWALGVPVTVDGEAVAAFSVSGPRYRLEGDWFTEELPGLLRGTANELELKLEYS